MAERTAKDWLRIIQETNQAELEAWRRRYPDMAGFVAEEARAKVEGREPNYGTPIARLSS